MGRQRQAYVVAAATQVLAAPAEPVASLRPPTDLVQVRCDAMPDAMRSLAAMVLGFGVK